ncbi:MAG: hypothetical protein OHK0029_38740 [Armatimonadaceae bacterium]
MLNELLGQLMGGGTVGQMSQQVGANEQTTQNAIMTSLPLLIGAMSQQTSTPEGSNQLMTMLDRDGDGDIMDDLSGFLSDPGRSTGTGNQVVETLFGGQRHQVENGLSRTTGLNSSQISSLLVMLAPIVLSFLARKKQESSLDSNGVASVLNQETRNMEQQGMPLMNVLSGVLDQNKDGSPFDDVMRVAGGLFGGRR